MNSCEGNSGVKSRLRIRAKNIVSRQNSGKENSEEETGKGGGGGGVRGSGRRKCERK